MLIINEIIDKLYDIKISNLFVKRKHQVKRQAREYEKIFVVHIFDNDSHPEFKKNPKTNE